MAIESISRRKINRGLNNEETNDSLREEAFNIYQNLSTQYGADRITAYIVSRTNSDKNLITTWLNNKGNSINTAIAGRILLSLQKFNPNDLVGIPGKFTPPLAPKKVPPVI